MAKKQKLVVSSGLNDEQLKALGALTCNASFLDHTLEILIWILSDFRSDFWTPAAILTDRMGDEQRKKVVKRLAKHLDEYDPGFYEKASNIVNKIGRLQGRRNEMIHAVWNMTKHPDLAHYNFKEQTPRGPKLGAKKNLYKRLDRTSKPRRYPNR